VDHLTLHNMIRNLDSPEKEELKKLQMLKDELVRDPIDIVGAHINPSVDLLVSVRRPRSSTSCVVYSPHGALRTEVLSRSSG
jgi:hypothetical protein